MSTECSPYHQDGQESRGRLKFVFAVASPSLNPYSSLSFWISELSLSFAPFNRTASTSAANLRIAHIEGTYGRF